MYRKSGHVVVLYEFISPEFMARQNYSGVVFHSGDIAIDPHTYDPAVLFEFMDAHSLHVVSPLVPGSIWRPMSTPGLVPLGPPRSDVMYGRRTNFIEACARNGGLKVAASRMTASYDWTTEPAYPVQIGQLTAFDFIG
jgi:hypothetical protein